MRRPSPSRKSVIAPHRANAPHLNPPREPRAERDWDVARAVELQGQAVRASDRPEFRAALDQYKAKLASTH